MTTKRIGSFVGAVTVLCLVTHAAPVEAKLMSVKVRTANFRAGPSLEAEIVFTADRNFPVRILERKRGWVKIVDFEQERAWVAARLLSARDTAIAKVQVGNVRSGPGIRHGVVDKIHYGETFRISKRRGRWLELSRDGQTIGWVRDDLTWGDEEPDK